MPAPKRANIGPAVAKRVRTAQDKHAANLRAAGWLAVPPDATLTDLRKALEEVAGDDSKTKLAAVAQVTLAAVADMEAFLQTNNPGWTDL